MTGRVVTATEFRAKCLAYVDEMERSGETITITRRGRPVAILSSAKKTAWKSPRNNWAGRMEIARDIVNTDTSSLWEVVGPNSEEASRPTKRRSGR
jgi:prevent-host-death family protein